MTDRSKNREETIFYEALELPREEREAYLKDACGEDAELYSRVEALLKSHDVDDSFLGSSPVDAKVTLEGAPGREVCGSVIGRYKLLEQIGEGGMATVFMAEQTHPFQRKVALKVIKLGMDTKQVIARFEAERQALALMDHPNIAKVFDAGTTETGRPYFVMELVRGVAVTEYCDKNNLNPKERLDLFILVCQAIQHAHQKGIIHRDIKPSNVLVTLHDGNPVPKVIDFGIAKAVNQRLTEKTLFTRFAQMIGTPEYMSPEQAEMSALDVDTRTDIYSLGVLLYELLTGTTPVDENGLREAGYVEMQRIIREEEPVKPSTRLSTMGEALTEIAKHRKTNPDLLPKLMRGDLDWIVMKSLEKDRTRRYGTATELAAEIERHLNNEPVQAGAPTVWYKSRKFVRRYRIHVTAGLLVAAALVVGFVMATYGLVQARQDRDRADEARGKESVARVQAEQAEKVAEGERQKAVDSLEQTQGLLYASDIRAAHEAVKQTNPFLAKEFIDRCPEKLRQWEWYRLNSLLDRSIMTLRGHEEGVCSVAFSPDGKRIVSGSTDKTVKVWDAATGAELTTLDLDAPSASSMTFSPDGKHIATWNEQIIRSWDAAKQIATWNEQTIGIWDVARGTKLKTFRAHQETTLSTGQVRQVRSIGATVFSPDGKWIAFGDRLTIRILDASTGEELKTLATRQETSGQANQFQSIPALAFSPDSKRIVSIDSRFFVNTVKVWDYESTIRVWDTESGEQLMTPLWHEGQVFCVAFSPNGKRFISGSDDGTVKVWDAESGEQLMAPLGQESKVLCVAFSPNGKRIVSGGGDYTASALRIWDAESGEELMILRGHESAVSCVAFSPDSRLMASGSYCDRAIKLWDTATGAELMTLDKHTGWVESVAFSPDGKRIVSGSGDNTVRVWDVATGRELMKLDGHFRDRWHSVAFSPSGEHILSGSRGKYGTIKLWDAATGKELKAIVQDQTRRRARAPHWAYAVAFSPDGKLIVSGGVGDRLIKVWNAVTGNELSTLRGHEGSVLSVAVSPDSKRIVSGSTDETVKLWDAESGRELMTLRGHRHDVLFVAFSTDGRLIASASSFDRAVKLWDASTGNELITFRGHSEILSCVSLSPDGKRIVVSGGNENITASAIGPGTNIVGSEGGETIKVWDTRTGTELRTLHHGSGVGSLAFCPDGKRIASGGMDGTIKIWDVTNGEELMALSGHQRQVEAEQKPTDGGSKKPAFDSYRPVRSLAFSPDGKRLVSSSAWDGSKVWDMQNGTEVTTLRESSRCVTFSPDSRRILFGGRRMKLLDADSGRTIATIPGQTERLLSGSIGVDLPKTKAKISSVAFSPDGRRISSGSSDGSAKVWDIETGAEVTTLSSYRSSARHFAFSPDGKRIAAIAGNEVTIRDGATGKVVATLGGYENGFFSIAFSPDGKRIVSGGGNGDVKVWDVETGAEIMTPLGHKVRISFLSYSSDGTRIISGDALANIKVWDAVTGAELMTLMGHQGEVSSVAFSPDGKRFISGSSDKTIKVWDFTASPAVRTLGVPYRSSVALSPDGKRIAVGGNGIKLWDAYSGKELTTILIPAKSSRLNQALLTATARSVKFSPDGKHIISGHNDNILRIRDATTGRELMTIGGHYEAISSVDYSPDGKKIVSGSGDQTVKVWDAATGKELMVFAGHERDVKSVAFSADGKRIVSLARKIKLWDVATGKELLNLPSGAAWCVSLSPDGTRVAAAGGGYGVIKVWDVETGAEVMIMRGHTGPVEAVAFSPDGQRIVSGSLDKTVKVWDALTGNELMTLGEHDGIVLSVAFSSDGKQVISVGEKTIKLWDTASPQEVTAEDASIK